MKIQGKKVQKSGAPIFLNSACTLIKYTTQNGVLKRSQVVHSIHREYGHTLINIKIKSPIFNGIKKNKLKVWMSHGDNINKIPKLFSISSISDNKIISSIENIKHKIVNKLTNLKLFLKKTPTINNVITESDKNNSGNI